MTKKRIKHSGRAYPKVDFKKLAKALGADSITGPQQVNEQGREYFECDVIAKDGLQVLRAYKLLDTELTAHKLLGEAEGQSFFLCLFMGRHVENFHNRVCGYQILKPTVKGMKFRVAFYEKT